MIPSIFPTILLLIYFVYRVSGHAYYMLNSPDCSDTPLTLGYSPIMGPARGKVLEDTSGKTITVRRNGVSLSSGSNFAPGETLTIGINLFTSSTGELVLEARGK